MLYASRVAGWSLPKAGALLALFCALTLVFGALPQHWLNGSIGYAPALLFLLGLGLWHRAAGRKEPFALLAACGLFTVSLALRTSDMALCAALPTGVHFLWHCLNACVLYLTLRALILSGRS